MFKVNNKDTRTTPEQVNAGFERITFPPPNDLITMPKIKKREYLVP